MPRLASGTKAHPSRPTEVWMNSYTDQQLEQLEKLKDPKYALGIADAKYANHALLPDGSVTADIATIRKHIKDEVQSTSAHLLAATREQRVAARAAANRAQDLQDEFEDHVEQGRFLFILNDEGLPLVYFQVATAENPDMPMLKSQDTPAHREKAEKVVEEAAANDRKLRLEAQRKAATEPTKTAHPEG